MGIMNTYVYDSLEVGGGRSVWDSIDEKYPKGGRIDISQYEVGDLIPAGSMVILKSAGGLATIVGSEDTDKLEDVNCLLENDIYVRPGTKAITATCVTKGAIYADRLEFEIPKVVEEKLKGGITIIREVEPKEEIEE